MRILTSLALKHSKFGIFYMTFLFDCPALIIIYWITFNNFHLSTLCTFVHYLSSSEIITYCAERKWQLEFAHVMNISLKDNKLPSPFENSGIWKFNDKDFSVTHALLYYTDLLMLTSIWRRSYKNISICTHLVFSIYKHMTLIYREKKNSLIHLRNGQGRKY